jgi:hypothetical protein
MTLEDFRDRKDQITAVLVRVVAECQSVEFDHGNPLAARTNAVSALAMHVKLMKDVQSELTKLNGSLTHHIAELSPERQAKIREKLEAAEAAAQSEGE